MTDHKEIFAAMAASLPELTPAVYSELHDELAKALLAERVSRKRAELGLARCESCGEVHGAKTDCPPHEVRSRRA